MRRKEQRVLSPQDGARPAGARKKNLAGAKNFSDSELRSQLIS
jgi:hypothetical protein